MNGIDKDKNVKNFFDKIGEQLNSILEKIFKDDSIKNNQKISKIKEIFARKIKEIVIGYEINNKERYLVNTINVIIIILILLYKQNYIKREDFVPPESFILRFFESISSILNVEVLKKFIDIETGGIKDFDLFELFKSQIQDVSDDIWKKVSETSTQELVLLYWSNLDKLEKSDVKDHNEESEINIESVIKKCPETVKEIKPIPVTGNYESYINYLNKELQFHMHIPDLILIDTILLAEYKEKGVFDSIQNYLKQELKDELKNMNESQSEIGKTLNGSLDTIPLTRNFHLPACGKEFKFNYLDKYIRFDRDNFEIKDTFPLKEIVVRKNKNHFVQKDVRNKWECNLMFSADGNKNRFFSIDKIEITDWVPFITYMGNAGPFIPMQGAKSAHMAYTIFAYFAGGGDDHSDCSFLKIEQHKNDVYEIIIWPQSKFKKPVSEFFRCIYNYVPFISLCCEHNTSAILRYFKNKLWFDPCLPIEAERFEIEADKIIFGSKPANGVDNYLSCLGGYCLALVNNSKDKYKATEAAIKISKNYFLEAVKKKASRRELNNRIKFNDANILDNDFFKKSYIDFEDLDRIAKRPSFHGWKILEEIISNIVRLYLSTILIYRSIVAEMYYVQKVVMKNSNDSTNIRKIYANISKKEIKEIEKGINNEQHVSSLEHFFIENILNDTNIGNYLNRIKNYLKNWFINIKSKPKVYLTFLEDEQKIENWINANFDCIIADSIYINSLLKGAVNHIKYIGENKTDNRHESIFDFLSEQMIKSFIGKLKGTCLSHGWDFREGMKND